MSCLIAGVVAPFSSHAAPPSYIAVLGHSGSHAPQLMHSSVINVDIFLSSEPYSVWKQIACYRESVRSSDNIGAHQVGQVCQHYSALASTTRRASSMNASLLGCAGFAITIGIPASPASRTSG